MVTAFRNPDGGFSLVEMMLVVALLGTVLAVVFGGVGLLTTSTANSTEESAAAHDLSYSMELLSKPLMSGRLLYAGDYQVNVLTQRADGTYEMNSIFATATPGAVRGSLVWQRWSSNASGTVAPGAVPTRWVMSDRNMNRITPQAPLFSYYRNATNESTVSVSAGAYVVSEVRRIRLHVLAGFNEGVRDDFRDVVPRVGS